MAKANSDEDAPSYDKGKLIKFNLKVGCQMLFQLACCLSLRLLSLPTMRVKCIFTADGCKRRTFLIFLELIQSAIGRNSEVHVVKTVKFELKGGEKIETRILVSLLQFHLINVKGYTKYFSFIVNCCYTYLMLSCLY